MAIRTKLRQWLGIDGRIREVLRTELAARSLPQASEVQALREQVEELTASVASTQKKVKMVMGTVQASTAQLMQVHDALDKIGPQGKKAIQQSTIARNTAESTADGLEALEAQVAALMERLPDA